MKKGKQKADMNDLLSEKNRYYISTGNISK